MIIRTLLICVSLTQVCIPSSISANEQPAMMFGDTTRRQVPFSKDPHVVRFHDKYLMYYSIPPAHSNPVWGIGIAESSDLIHWTRIGEIKPAASYEMKGFCAPCAIVHNGQIHLFYQTYGNGNKDAICHASSSDGLNFQRNPSNPVFSPPKSSWSNGRAIDAEVILFNNTWFLYFATRNPSGKIQQIGVATAPATTNFSRDSWKLAHNAPILSPLLPWEKQCIEAPSVIQRQNRLYMFYAGAYNNEPQQIGVASSTDGIHWIRLSDQPLLKNGSPGSWNSSESGHPHIFTDPSTNKTYLFYQGNNNHGKTWFLSQREIFWPMQKPSLTP